jgi:hypothetical protein
MRQKQLIAPEPPSLDRSQYKFNSSFSRSFYFYVSIFVLEVFIQEIITPGLTIIPISKVLPLLAFVLMFLSLTSFFVTYVIVKISKYIINPLGIDGINFWSIRTFIDWQDITSTKVYYICGLRNLAIKHATPRKRNIHIGLLFLYELPIILNRVREYAGEEHPLTIALEKEVSLPRQRPDRTLWRIIAGISIVLSIWLISGNLYAEYREQPLNQAIASYVRQHPKTAPNQSAIDLQASIAKLGFSVEKFGDGSKVKVTPNKTALAEREKIDAALNSYLELNNDLAKTENSFLPIPTKLHTYLNNHQSEIAEIENQLLDRDLPDWGSDSAWLDRSDPNAGDSWTVAAPNYWDLNEVKKILVLNIIDLQQLQNSDISQGLTAKGLAAIGKLNRSLQNPILLPKLFVSEAIEASINNLVRKLDLIPDRWEQDLLNPGFDKMIKMAIERRSMGEARFYQDPQLIMRTASDKRIPVFLNLSVLRYHHLAKPLTRLVAVNVYEDIQKGLSYWSQQNICRTDGKSGVDSYTAMRYPVAIVGYLDRELTQGIRQIKSQLGAGQPIYKVASEFKLGSKTCPGEQWTAKVKDGSVEVSFSHPPNWKALGMEEKYNLDRFTYLIKPKVQDTSSQI